MIKERALVLAAVFILCSCKDNGGSSPGSASDQPTAGASTSPEAQTPGEPEPPAKPGTVAVKTEGDDEEEIEGEDGGEDEDDLDELLSDFGISSQISVLAAKDEAAIATAGTLNIATNLYLDDDEPTDFDRDRTDVTVADNSMSSVDLANNLLCILNQSAYGEMLNKNFYVATVDIDACFRRGKLDPAGSLAKPRTQARLIVKATRGTNEPITVRAWFGAEVENQGYDFSIVLTVHEGASSTNPFGRFKLKYRANQKGSDAAVIAGALDSTTVGRNVMLNAIEGSGGFAGQPQGTTWTVAKLGYDEAGKNSFGTAVGRKSTTFDLSGGASSEQAVESLSVAYDAERYRATKDSSTTCRDRAHPKTEVYRTGVYDKATMRRVYSGQSFFTISQPDGSGGTNFGQVTGFNPPIRFYPEPDVGDHFTIHKRDAQGNTTTSQGTVAKSLGILYKRTAYPLPVEVAKGGSYIAQEDFLTADNDMPNYSPHLSIARWNPANQVFEAVQRAAGMTFDFVPVTPPARFLLDGTDILFKVGIDDSDIPTMRVTVNTGSADQTPQLIKLNLQPYVSGAVTQDIFLRCLYSCLRPNLTATMLTTGNDRFFPNPASINDAIPYVFDVGTQTLMHLDGNTRAPITIVPSDLDMPDPGSPHYWPAMGNLVLESEYQSLKATNGFEMPQNALETYGWATLGNVAPNAEANRFKYLRDDATGESLKVTGNIRIGHVVRTTDVVGALAAPYTDKTYVVFGADEFGFLQGIPATGDNSSGYSPSFGFKPGIEIKGLDGHAYVVKPLDVLETMPSVATSECGGLVASADLPAPLPGSELATTFDSAPNVTDAPKVVAGKVLDL